MPASGASAGEHQSLRRHVAAVTLPLLDRGADSFWNWDGALAHVAVVWALLDLLTLQLAMVGGVDDFEVSSVIALPEQPEQLQSSNVKG